MKCRPQLWIILFYSMGYQFFRITEVSTTGATLKSREGNNVNGSSSPSILQFSSVSLNTPPETPQRAKSTYQRTTNKFPVHKSSNSVDEMSLNPESEKRNDSSNSRISLTPRNRKREISLASSSSKNKNTISTNSVKLSRIYKNATNSSIYYPRTSGLSSITQLISGEAGTYEGRTLIMATVGLINGFIAVSAAFGMGGVIFSGLLLVIKLMLKAMIILVGWIYII